jgi:hypothetical protein
MLRLRLACLALATGFVVTISGCCSSPCEDSRLFPRLFNSGFRSGSSMRGDCDCHNSMSPNMMMDPAAQGPILMPGATGSTPIIKNAPLGTPPQVFKIPTATTTPYVPPSN